MASDAHYLFSNISTGINTEILTLTLASLRCDTEEGPEKKSAGGSEEGPQGDDHGRPGEKR